MKNSSDEIKDLIDNKIEENNVKIENTVINKIENKMEGEKDDIKLNKEIEKKNIIIEEILNTSNEIDIDDMINDMVENTETRLLDDNDDNDKPTIFTGIINIDLIKGENFPLNNSDTSLYLYVKLKLCNQIQKTLLIKDNLNIE